MTVQNIRTMLRLTHEQGLSVREIGLRLKLSKTTVATHLRADRYPQEGREVKADLEQYTVREVDPTAPCARLVIARMRTRSGI